MQALAREREQKATELEAALVVAGRAFRDFLRITAALSDHVGADFHQKLAVPILLHMSRAGFSSVLERQLQVHGTPASLRALVAEQHATIAGADHRQDRSDP